MKAIFIVNPGSGEGSGESYQEAITNKIKEKYEKVEVRVTEKEGDALDWARQACDEKCDGLFVLGGDGTVNEVVSGVAEEDYKPRIGIFPGGTVNNMSRTLGFPNDINQTIDTMDFDSYKKVDIGKVNDRYFIYSVSLGQIPEAIHNVTYEEKNKWGPMAYMTNIFKEIQKDELKALRIKYDSTEVEGNFSHILVILTDQIGDFKFADTENSEDDGLFTAFFLRETSFGEKLGVVGEALKGDLSGNDNVESLRLTNLSVESITDEELEYDIDGDLGGKLPIKIQILPKHVEVYCHPKRLLKNR